MLESTDCQSSEYRFPLRGADTRDTIRVASMCIHAMLDATVRAENISDILKSPFSFVKDALAQGHHSCNFRTVQQFKLVSVFIKTVRLDRPWLA